MPASRGEGALNVESSVMVGVVHRDSREGRKAVSELAVVRRIPRREAELKHDRRAHADQAFGDERSECGRNDRPAQAGEDAGVSDITRTRHLVAAPGALGCVEIEPSGLAEQSDELEAAPRGDHLVQRGVHRGSKGRSSEDLTGFARDI